MPEHLKYNLLIWVDRAASTFVYVERIKAKVKHNNML